MTKTIVFIVAECKASQPNTLLVRDTNLLSVHINSFYAIREIPKKFVGETYNPIIYLFVFHQCINGS